MDALSNTNSPDNTADTIQASSLLNESKPIRILAVEDNVIAMNFLTAQISELGHKVMTATDGAQALEVLNENLNNIDVILMDREMPVMDGLSAVKRIKSNTLSRDIPIIMVTGADSSKQMQEGLNAGVFYYLTKPVNEEMLRSVLSAAVREAQQARTLSEELNKHKTSFNLIETCRFQFSTLTQAESLAAFIANCYPQPTRVLRGLGELLINAIEHGNLQIGYDKKTQLIEDNIWRSEIERRQQLPEYIDKKATATVSHKEDGTYLVIEDEGDGFNWREYIQIDPERASDNHGRGIAQAKTMSFDKLTFNETGNQVIAFVNKDKQIDW